jgi:hypothetical protein
VDLIVLFFLARYIGNLAFKKGLVRWKWVVGTVIAWVAAEFFGFAFCIVTLGFTDILSISLFSTFCGFGGFLFTHALLRKKPYPPGKDPTEIL